MRLSSSRAIAHIDITGRLTVILCLGTGGELAQDVRNSRDDSLLLLFIEPLGHVLDDSVEGGNGGRAQIQEHDNFTLGEVVGAQTLKQLGDAAWGISEGILAEGAGMGAHVL